jgi:2-polyprenyl-3-methyl-5-hydroxy-6-metoxy-1,4-benzoquinol methylase
MSSQQPSHPQGRASPTASYAERVRDKIRRSAHMGRTSEPPQCVTAPRYQRNFKRYGTHSLILDLVPPLAVVLDVGCASGFLGQALSTRDCVVSGLDRESSAIEAARPFYRDVQVIDLDRAEDLPWATGSFDVILAADVLEHLTDPAKSLAMLKNYVRPSGCVIISLPNVAHLSVRVPLLFGRFSYRETGILDRTHLHFYTFRTAVELAMSCGLRVERTYAGSDRLGFILSKLNLPRHLLGGPLAHNIILLCRRNQPTGGT